MSSSSTARRATVLASTSSTALVVLASLSVLAAPSSTAASTTVVHTQVDAVDDVWVRGATPDEWAEHGARRNVDLLASRVRHAPRKIITTGWFTDLAPTTDRTSTVFWIHPSAGRTYRVRHTTGPSNRTGRVSFTQYVDGRLHGRTCSGLTHLVSFEDDLMRVTVPRPCVGRPAWVQYHGVATAVETETGATYSDAMMDRGPDNQVYSPRIVRDTPPSS